MKTTVHIEKPEDFNEIRNLKGEKLISIIISKDIDFKFQQFEPIDFSNENCSIIISGFGHTICNLYLSSAANGTGIFSCVNGVLNVNDLVLQNVIVDGVNNVGVLAGSCENSTVRDSSLINCQAKGNNNVGGYIGQCNSFVANNVSTYSLVDGETNVGALAGNTVLASIRNVNVDKIIRIGSYDFLVPHEVYVGAYEDLDVDEYSFHHGITYTGESPTLSIKKYNFNKK